LSARTPGCEVSAPMSWAVVHIAPTASGALAGCTCALSAAWCLVRNKQVKKRVEKWICVQSHVLIARVATVGPTAAAMSPYQFWKMRKQMHAATHMNNAFAAPLEGTRQKQ